MRLTAVHLEPRQEDADAAGPTRPVCLRDYKDPIISLINSHVLCYCSLFHSKCNLPVFVQILQAQKYKLFVHSARLWLLRSSVDNTTKRSIQIQSGVSLQFSSWFLKVKVLPSFSWRSGVAPLFPLISFDCPAVSSGMFCLTGFPEAFLKRPRL